MIFLDMETPVNNLNFELTFSFPFSFGFNFIFQQTTHLHQCLLFGTYTVKILLKIILMSFHPCNLDMCIPIIFFESSHLFSLIFQTEYALIQLSFQPGFCPHHASENVSISDFWFLCPEAFFHPPIT